MKHFSFPDYNSAASPGSLSELTSANGRGSSRGPTTYLSTYNREYMGTHGTPAPNARVGTSQFYPAGRPDIASTYQAEYMNFPTHKRTSIPYGTSSGYRKNNPHPHNMVAAFRHPNRDYFVWPHYQRLPPLLYSQEPDMSSKALLNQVCQDKIRTIYQQDFHEPPYATDSSRPSTRLTRGVAQPSSSSDRHSELTR